MVPTPSFQSANVLDASPGTPRLRPQQQNALTPGKNTQAGASFRLCLKTILGTTTVSPRGFDCLPDASSFAICAGSAAVVVHVDQDFNVTQRYFRARPNALPVNRTLSYYDEPPTPNKTETRSRIFSTLRENNHGIKPTASPLIERANTFGGSTIRQKTRAVTCVSLSADGKLLAIGEVGYNPRIVIFSTAASSTDAPLSCLSEHAFGVRCLAFSHDMRWLCSIGDVQDGFVYLWAINAKSGSAKLHSSNKCTSIVHGLAWVGTSFVSVGTRHVKVWRLEPAPATSPSRTKFRLDNMEPSLLSSPVPRIILGRNCLLGRLMEATFTSITPIDDCKAILCTDKGDVCVFDDTDRTQNLYTILRVQFDVKSVAIDYVHRQVWIGGTTGEVRAIPLDDLALQPNRPVGVSQVEISPSRAHIPPASRSNKARSPAVLAIGLCPKALITIDSDRTIKIYRTAEARQNLDISSAVQTLRSHAGPALGVGLLHHSDGSLNGFFTWSACTVVTWTLEGGFKRALDVVFDQPAIKDEGEVNELKVVKASEYGDYIVSGDNTGMLRLHEGPYWEDVTEVKAHTGEINDIVIVRRPENTSLVISCGRDRTIQVYLKRSSRLEILQTIDQHLSTVNQLLCISNGDSLLSSSSDRTIVVHALASVDDSVAYIPMRIITLKTSPISMSLVPDNVSTLLIATLDKQIHQYDIPSGQHIHSLRATDVDNNESVLLGDLSVQDIKSPGGITRLIFGFQTADKTIRVHDRDTGVTISKVYGHSEGISGISFVQYGNEHGGLQLVSTGMDGTIMLFDVIYDSNGPADRTSAMSTSQETPNSLHAQPLRRALSRLTILEYQKNLDANAIAGLPESPTGNRFASRIRKRPSKHALADLTPRSTLSATMPSKADTPQSLPRRSSPPPSPPAVHSLRPDRRRPSLGEKHRTKSAGNLSDFTASAEQLCKSLRAYRKKLSASSGDALRCEVAKELEEELGLTIRAIGQKTKRYQTASETMVGNLLNQYSEKLAQMVEEKVTIGVANNMQARPLAESKAHGVEADLVVTSIEKI